MYYVNPDGPDNCVPVNYCTSNPCRNNATCHNETGGFKCNCAAGYTGSLCQHDIDDCLSNPCVHGQCLDMVDGWECDCDAGYNGELTKIISNTL